MYNIELENGKIIVTDFNKEILFKEINDPLKSIITVPGKLADEADTGIRRISFNKDRVVMIY